MSACQEAEFVCMFFRLENRWPVQLMRSISEFYSPEQIDLRTQDYIICSNLPDSSYSNMAQDLGDTTSDEVYKLAVAALGVLRTTAYGLKPNCFSFQKLRDNYNKYNILRDRRIFGSFRDRSLAGIAIIYLADFPINFSYLCRRVEIIVHPHAPDRIGVVSELISAVITQARLRAEHLIPILVDPIDTPIATALGFLSTGKQYTNFIWSREGVRGFASTAIAFSHWYGKMEKVSTLKDN